MTGHSTAQARRDYYDRQYRTELKRGPAGTQVNIPENVEIREFSSPCFLCNARGACRHRRAYSAESRAESATA